MSVIPQVYNQGTGLVGSTSDSNQIPGIVQDLIVENTLTVLGTTTLEGPVNVENDMTVNGTITVEDLIVTDAVVLDNVEVNYLTVNNTLDVLNDTTTLNLEVTGAVNGAIDFTGAVKCEDTLEVLGDTTVQDLQTNGTIGKSTAPFDLPTAQPTVGDVLKCTATAPNIETSWQPDTAVQDYVSYDAVTNELIDNPPGTPPAVITDINQLNITDATIGNADITNATVTGEIGSATATFQLPVTDPVSDGLVLKVTGAPAGPYTTSWEADQQIADYVRYDPATDNLISEPGSSVITDIDVVNIDCAALSATLGVTAPVASLDRIKTAAAPNSAYLELPAAAGTAGQVLSILSTGANGVVSTWDDIPTQIPNYVTLDTVNNIFLNNIPPAAPTQILIINTDTINCNTFVGGSGQFVTLQTGVLSPSIVNTAVYETPAGTYMRLPSGTPNANDTIRFNGGSGSITTPHNTIWAP